jgi:glycosyltransferase involved in cell wall biosynthesis
MHGKLTVLIPCKNERRNIRPCIQAARLVADEILVADCYSTDGTPAIVVEEECRLIQREFVNFASFKNWAIPQARYPWVLIVDCDERVTEELAWEIKQVLQGPPEHIDAYAIPRLLFFMGHPIRFGGCQNDRPVRLIRRDRCRYETRRVHEKIVSERRRVSRLRSQLLHYSFWTYDEFLTKNLLYTEWAAQDFWAQGRKTGFVNLFLRPLFRFLQLYVWQRGFLDGLPGLQLCMLKTFVLSFLKQGRLWEMEHALKPPADGLVPGLEQLEAADPDDLAGALFDFDPEDGLGPDGSDLAVAMPPAGAPFQAESFSSPR